MAKLEVRLKKSWIQALLGFFLAFLLSQIIGNSLALAFEPQLNYPTLRLPGIVLDITQLIRDNLVTLADLARYIYYFLVMIAGIVAFLSFAWGGIKVVTGTALQEIQTAKEQMRMSLWGLLIILFSWLILVTLDPRLVVIPKFEPIASRPPLPRKIEPQFRDGIIFETNHPEVPKIAVPLGQIRVEDTARFQVGQSYFNLSEKGGIGLGCAVGGVGCPYRVTRVTIVNPMREGKPIPKYTYGVACFQHPYFKGPARIVVDPNSLDGRPHRTVLTVSPALFDNPMLSAPCGSILVFRMPFLDPTDSNDWKELVKLARSKIIFYELPYPDREKRHPGTGKRVIVGECYMIAGPVALGENVVTKECKRAEELLVSNWTRGLGFDPFGNRGQVGLYLKTTLRDPDTDREIRSWWPRSMEIEPEGRFLVFLFNDTEGLCTPDGSCRDEHWEMGLSYWFTSGVDNFEDFNDKRLYWQRTPLAPGPDAEVKALPEKAIIFIVEEVF